MKRNAEFRLEHIVHSPFFAGVVSRGYIIVSFLLFLSLHGYSQEWVRIIPTFSTGDTMLNMSNGVMVTKDIGWFAVNSVILDSGKTERRLYKTINGGTYWTLQFSSQALYAFGKIMPIDSLHCFIPFGRELLKTTDGGLNWENKEFDSTIVNGGGTFFFFDKNNGFAYLKYPIKTTNGGDTWEVLDTSTSFSFQSDIYFPTRNKGWITGSINPDWTDSGYLLKSNDSGKTWQFAHDPNYPPPTLLAIDYVDSLHGFIMGANVTSSCFVSYTWNGGDSGGTSYTHTSGCSDVAFLDSMNGWVTNSAGKISTSTDGGRTWNVNQLEENVRLGKISTIRSERIAFIFGEKNTLLRADMMTGVNDKHFPTNFTLYQNYPNPFNPVTVIAYQLSSMNLVTLKVLDVLGREVTTLVNSRQLQGSYEVAFNAVELPSGIYLYELATQNERVRKKMIYLK